VTCANCGLPWRSDPPRPRCRCRTECGGCDLCELAGRDHNAALPHPTMEQFIGLVALYRKPVEAL
jgi:hypothetical protein